MTKTPVKDEYVQIPLIGTRMTVAPQYGTNEELVWSDSDSDGNGILIPREGIIVSSAVYVKLGNGAPSDFPVTVISIGL